MTADGVTGLVVAGGRSTRFGDRGKALASVAGQPMLRRVVATVSSVTGGVVVNCRADQREGFSAALDTRDASIRFAIDSEVDEGPLAGLLCGLTAIDTELALVLGCDMPLVDGEALGALRQEIGPDDDAAVPTTPGGPEPLLALYRVEPTRAAADGTLADGERSLRALLDRLRVQTVPVGEGSVPEHAVTSVDTPADLERVEGRLRESE